MNDFINAVIVKIVNKKIFHIIVTKNFSFSAIIIIMAPKFRNIAILGQNFCAIMMIIALNEKFFVTIMVSISLESN